MDKTNMVTCEMIVSVYDDNHSDMTAEILCRYVRHIDRMEHRPTEIGGGVTFVISPREPDIPNIVDILRSKYRRDNVEFAVTIRYEFNNLYS